MKRLVKSYVLVLALVIPTASTAFAQMSGQPGPGGQHLGKAGVPARVALPEEHLAMPQFPGGWAHTVIQAGQVEIFEYLPKNQTAATWRDKISLEVHHGSNTLPLDAYQRRALGLLRENCDDVFEGQFQTGMNNGFPAAYWTLGCKHDKRGNFGETRYTKAIQGGETLYLLTRAWRTPVYGDNGPPLSPEVLDQARQFLGTSVVCANVPQYPCPDTGNTRP